MRRLDHQLWKHGRAWLDEHGGGSGDISSRTAGEGPDVYLASHVYNHGGHTALIGDFVRARPDHAASAHLVLTNASSKEPSEFTPEILARIGIPADRTTNLKGGSLDERLDALFARLLELRPGRLFLFHHHDDPVAVAACQPEICTDCVLVHHNDVRPSFGLHLPGVPIIELNPWGAAIARAQRLFPELLLLTCPDPGPRPHGFLRKGALVTASSGSAQKFGGTYVYRYPEAVARILKTTRGRHVHIGPLNETLEDAIDEALRSADVDPDGFVHCPWVPSVARALWEYDCDVYVASFPTDGLRAMIEVAASGTPYLTHTGRQYRDLEGDAIVGAGTTWWRTWHELEARLLDLSDRDRLEEKAKRIRQRYMRFHHPSVFEETLGNILRGGEGLVDPQASDRDRAMLSLVSAALTRELIEGRVAERDALAELRRDLAELPSAIETSVARQKAATREVESNLLRLIEEKYRATSEGHARLAEKQAALIDAHSQLLQKHKRLVGRFNRARRKSRDKSRRRFFGWFGGSRR